MTPAEADWVYEHVITQRYKESSGCIMWTGAREKRRDEGRGAVMLRTCPCQYGPCGRCADGRPELCAYRRGAGPVVPPEARILDRAGYAVAEVRRTGRPCRWVCPGPARDVQEQLFAVTSVPPPYRPSRPEGGAPEFSGQLELFAVGGAR